MAYFWWTNPISPPVRVGDAAAVVFVEQGFAEHTFSGVGVPDVVRGQPVSETFLEVVVEDISDGWVHVAGEPHPDGAVRGSDRVQGVLSPGDVPVPVEGDPVFPGFKVTAFLDHPLDAFGVPVAEVPVVHVVLLDPLPGEFRGHLDGFVSDRWVSQCVSFLPGSGSCPGACYLHYSWLVHPCQFDGTGDVWYGPCNPPTRGDDGR